MNVTVIAFGHIQRLIVVLLTFGHAKRIPIVRVHLFIGAQHHGQRMALVRVAMLPVVPSIDVARSRIEVMLVRRRFHRTRKHVVIGHCLWHRRQRLCRRYRCRRRRRWHDHRRCRRCNFNRCARLLLTRFAPIEDLVRIVSRKRQTTAAVGRKQRVFVR